MIDTKLPLRRAYYQLLNGNISVPIYDDVVKLADDVSSYVLLSSQTSNDDSRLCCWASIDTILLDIVCKFDGRANKESVDIIANEIFSVLLPDVWLNNLPAQPGISIFNVKVESDNTLTQQLGTRQQIIRRLITFTQQVNQT